MDYFKLYKVSKYILLAAKIETEQTHNLKHTLATFSISTRHMRQFPATDKRSW